MKTLIVYYSRSNTTKTVAEYLKKELNADIDEITTDVNYDGALGYAKGIKDSFQEKIININSYKYDPSNYDKIIIGTPVWTSKLANPILTYINQNKNKLNNVDLFIVGKSNGFDKVKEHFTKVTNINPNSVNILEKDISSNEYKNKINALL